MLSGDPAASYSYQVGRLAYTNSVKAAVEVYLIVAKTGRLPEKLPEYVPKDPFTGLDFVYETTDEGFTLRCQGDNTYEHKVLAFKARE